MSQCILHPITGTEKPNSFCSLPCGRLSIILLRIAVVACEAGIISMLIPSISAIYFIMPTGISALMYYSSNRYPFDSILEVIPIVRLVSLTITKNKFKTSLVKKQEFEFNFSRLPEELTSAIFDLLPGKDVVRTQRCNRFFKDRVFLFYLYEITRLDCVLKSLPHKISQAFPKDAFDVALQNKRMYDHIRYKKCNVNCGTINDVLYVCLTLNSNTFFSVSKKNGESSDPFLIDGYFGTCVPISEKEFLITTSMSCCKVFLEGTALQCVDKMHVPMELMGVRVIDKIENIVFIKAGNGKVYYISLRSPLKIVELAHERWAHSVSNGREVIIASKNEMIAYSVNGNETVVCLWKRVWDDNQGKAVIRGLGANLDWVAIPHRKEQNNGKTALHVINVLNGDTIYYQSGFPYIEPSGFWKNNNFGITESNGSLYFWHIPLKRFLGSISLFDSYKMRRILRNSNLDLFLSSEDEISIKVEPHRERKRPFIIRWNMQPTGKQRNQ